jgi:hypothetical protein
MVQYQMPLPGSFGVWVSVSVEDQDVTVAGSLQAKLQALTDGKADLPAPTLQADAIALVVPSGAGDT